MPINDMFLLCCYADASALLGDVRLKVRSSPAAAACAAFPYAFRACVRRLYSTLPPFHVRFASPSADGSGTRRARAAHCEHRASGAAGVAGRRTLAAAIAAFSATISVPSLWSVRTTYNSSRDGAGSPSSINRPQLHTPPTVYLPAP